jgi:hypothetical protein
MARKGRGSSPASTEVPVVRICGLRPNGDTVSITVYRKGKSVLLSGPNGSHIVHAMHEKNSQGWIRETILVWKLSNVYDEHPIHTDVEQSRRAPISRPFAKCRSAFSGSVSCAFG